MEKRKSTKTVCFGQLAEKVSIVSDLLIVQLPGVFQLGVKAIKQFVLGRFSRWMIRQPPTRFLIITRGRTGSHFLISLLASHPKVHISWAEPFGEYTLQQKRLKTKILRQGPVAYLNQKFQRKGSEQAIGLKTLYYQLEQPYSHLWKIDELTKVLPYLLQQKDIKIIHLKRRNRLKTLVSMRIADATQQYVLFNTKRRDDKPHQIELSISECEREFKQSQHWEQRYHELFAKHDMIEIFYVLHHTLFSAKW